MIMVRGSLCNTLELIGVIRAKRNFCGHVQSTMAKVEVDILSLVEIKLKLFCSEHSFIAVGPL